MSFQRRVGSSQRGQNMFLKAGLPFLILMVAGSYGLSEFTSTRYEKHELDVSKITKEQLAKIEKRKFNMEDEFKRLSKEIDVDNWEQVRMPRPEDLIKEKK